jgi:DNA mismatch endonuclease (patch repair protein)
MKERWIKTEFSTALSGRRSRNTAPEILLRRALHAAGFRFRLHRRIGQRLTADIVLPHYKTVIFVDGCFWHQHGCKYGGGRVPAGPNAAIWAAKLRRIKEREEMARIILENEGFAVFRVWECAIKADAGRVATVLALSFDRDRSS